MYKIVVTDDRYGNYEEENRVLQEINTSVEVHDFVREEEAIPILRDADGVLVNLFPLSRRVIEAMDRCKIISRYGVGYDNVDIAAAEEQNIWVARVPDYCTEDVSDHAMALLLGSIRGIVYKDRRVREGGWNLQDEIPCRRIQGKTLGIIGYGRSGRALRKKIGGFDVSKVLVYDPFISARFMEGEGVVPTDLSTILAESDYISIHVPLTGETNRMIGKAELDAMKESAILINTSRGPVIDEEALYTALKDGKIAAAGLDVYREEPLPLFSPLKSLDTVVLTDHTGWYSEESVKELKRKAALNVLETLTRGKPLYPVTGEGVQSAYLQDTEK